MPRVRIAHDKAWPVVTSLRPVAPHQRPAGGGGGGITSGAGVLVGRRGVQGPYGVRGGMGGGRGGVSTWLGVGVRVGLGLVANPNPNQVVEGG